MSRAMIIDGNAAEHAAWNQLFRDHGYKAAAFANGFEALSEGLTNPPDVVVIDMEAMPSVGQGMLLVENFRAELPDTPILVVAGGPLSLICESIRELGADVCVSKPVDHAALLKMIDIMVDHLKPRVHTKPRTRKKDQPQLVH